MGGPTDGKYRIVSRVDYFPWIGADNVDDCAVKPVITDGQMEVWSIKAVGEVYQLVLEDNWYSSKDGNQVVVRTSVDPGTRWEITPVGNDFYLIKSTDANTAWTASESEPKNPVVLNPINNPVDPDPYMLWKFTPVLED